MSDIHYNVRVANPARWDSYYNNLEFQVREYGPDKFIDEQTGTVFEVYDLIFEDDINE